MTPLDHIPIVTLLGTILLVVVSRFLVQFYRARATFAILKSQGLPMPPWHPVFGHLYFCYKITSELPKDAHPHYLPDMIRRELPSLGPIYYLDTWPFGPQMLIVASTNGLYQITQEHSLPKYSALKYFLQPIAEGMDLVTMEGDVWKTWRGIFNPGFSAHYLASLTSGIVEETSQFCEILQKLSFDRRLFYMKDLSDNLTMDVIGRVVMNAQLNSQRKSNSLVDGLRMQVKWLTFGPDSNPFKRYSPVRPLVYWYNTRRMNGYISQRIDSRFHELQDCGESSTKSNRSILDLVLNAYLSEDAARGGQEIDRTFKKFTMNQLKLFLFSGHDTTSSTVCWIIYILSTEPSVLTRVRAEHTLILGSDPAQVRPRIIADSSLLNRLPYTMAVIKDLLRLFPAVSGTRAGEPNFSVIDDAGRRYPTNGFLVWDNPIVIHRDPIYWERPDDFLPERWLVASDDALHPIKGAWRAFSHGPRNCIGQELAMIEMKVIIVMVARTFDFSLAYEEYDVSNGTKGKATVYGERGYQIQRAQPSGNLPCFVAKSLGA